MPRPIRYLQRWIIRNRSSQPVSVQEAHAKLQRPVHDAHQVVRKNLNTPQTNEVANMMFGRIRSTNHRFALTRAFRAAGVFGNETRNDLVNVRSWREVEQKIGKKRANMMQRTYLQALDAAREAERSIFVEGESRVRARSVERVQQPVHGEVIQGKFGKATQRKVA